MHSETPRPFTGPKHVDGADRDTIEHYRDHAKRLFGDTLMPAVIYKGQLYAKRFL